MSRVAVVILNWNGIDYLKKYLPSVVAHTDPGLADIYVSDNGSEDQSVNWIAQQYPQVKIIQLDRNWGFAEGYNLALRKIQSSYFLLLNSDVEVTPKWIEPLVNILDTDPSVGACMPKIKSLHDRSSFEYAGAAGGFIDTFGYPFCRGRILNHIETDHGQYDNNIDIFWASGACLLVRSELYFSAGGLDPFFFAHMEEIDLCWRLKNMGYVIRFCHESEVFHLGGGTLPKKNHRKTYLNFRNNLILIIKNLPAGQVIRVCTARLFLDLIAALYFLFKLDPGESFAVIHAYFSIITRAGKICKVRRETIRKIHPACHREIYPNSIVWNFYIRRIKEYSQLSF